MSIIVFTHADSGKIVFSSDTLPTNRHERCDIDSFYSQISRPMNISFHPSLIIYIDLPQFVDINMFESVGNGCLTGSSVTDTLPGRRGRKEARSEVGKQVTQLLAKLGLPVIYVMSHGPPAYRPQSSSLMESRRYFMVGSPLYAVIGEAQYFLVLLDAEYRIMN
jgi:hypothetical protein